MKPLNLDNIPCAPQSSNCVIWQGPNIPCIKLCTGDTISDVTYKLATELCTIMSELNLTSYDLSCLNLTTSQPTTFNELIQLLITKICELQNIPTSSTSGNGGCPDCVVTVAPCFQTGTQTTMQLLDYVTAIANKVCSILTQITTINSQISNLTSRVITIEQELANPPAPYIPLVQSSCAIGTLVIGNMTPIDIVVDQLINGTGGYCSLVNATGSPTNILTAISNTVLSTDLRLAGGGAMSSITGWRNTPVSSLSDSLVDMWFCIKDIRTAFGTITGSDVVASTDTNSGISVASATVGTTTTYTLSSKTTEVDAGTGISVTPVVTDLKTAYTVSVNDLGSLSNHYTPTVNPKVTPLSTVSLYLNGINQPLSINDFNTVLPSVNTSTGIWTCGTAGYYNVSFVVRMTNASGFNSGMVMAGIASTLSNKIYFSNTVSINQITQTIELSGSANMISLAANDTLVLKVLNATDQDYAVVSGDIVSMTIQRVK